MAGARFLLRNWRLGAMGAVVLALLCVAVLVVETMPPRRIAMATGFESGGFQKIGRQYQAVLGKAAVRLRLIETSGSMANLALLRDPGSGVAVALIQDGTIGAGEAADLESLGTLFYEPVWIFCRSEIVGMTPSAVRGRKVSVGPQGSGARALLLELFKRNGLDREIGRASCRERVCYVV